MADPQALLRSRGYVGLLVMAAIIGVPVSAAAYGFLALVDYLQKEIFTHLPHGLGFQAVPVWWPFPVLAVGGLLIALAIRYLPGRGGPSPAGGFKMHGAAGGIALSHLPGLPLVPAVAMGLGAMSVVMLTLPLTSVLLATILLFSDGLAVTPLVIVAFVAYVVAARIAPADSEGPDASTPPVSAAPPAAGSAGGPG